MPPLQTMIVQTPPPTTSNQEDKRMLDKLNLKLQNLCPGTEEAQNALFNFVFLVRLTREGA